MKDKYKRKYMWEREEEDVEGSRILFLGWRGGIFGVFLGLFFWFLEEEEDNL